jgi:stearoyl-CoA desaturase (delta-9 desaturase)
VNALETAGAQLIDDDFAPSVPARQATLAPTKTPSAGVLRFERAIASAIVVAPVVGLFAAIAWSTVYSLRWVDAALFVAMHLVVGLGITVGYHRLFTHRGFDSPPAVRVALAIAGSMALQGPVIRWIADHRRHHQFSDKAGDPHSPHLGRGSDVDGGLRALWHAHIGWFFDGEKTRIQRYAPDLLADRAITRVDRYYLVWVVAALLIPASAGWLLHGDWRGAISGLLWGGLVRIAFTHHATWVVNSICHRFGTRPFVTHDQSRNNWLLAIPTLGESWHNNHHAFPSSAVHGFERAQFDLSWRCIQLLGVLGLARNLKAPTAAQIAQKRAAAAAASA